MPLTFGARAFRFRWLPTLALLLVLPAFVALGFWQLDRAQQKRALFAQFESPPQRVLSLNEPRDIDPPRYSGVTAKGRYDDAHQFLLDSMTQGGFAGYHVLTPLKLPGGDRAVLVDRGWVPAGLTRADQPDTGIGGDLRDVAGRVDLPPRAGLRLGDASPADASGWPQVVLFPTIAELEPRLGYALEPFIVLLAPEAPGGYVREWRPGVPGPALHVGYAVQWFAFALAALIIYVVVNLEKAGDAGRD